MAEPKHKRAPHTDFQVLLFIVSLCFTCGLLLAVIAYGLSIPQKEAKDFDQSKQMLIAAKILNSNGYFELLEGDTLIPATFDSNQKILVKTEGAPVQATDDQIKEISALRIRPLLTNQAGVVSTFDQNQLTEAQYLEDNKKTGYANLPQKLFYAILPNEPNAGKITAADLAQEITQASVFVIPVSGFGLWAPIYGYIAIGPNGDEVLGTTWYDHGETPGLGANIAEAWWQKQFFGKLVFQESSEGSVDLQTADMGIIVVKGKVSDVYRDSPKAKSAVDGISGSTLTGEGVTAAYKSSLTPYREFLIKLNKAETS
ncbi:MAG: Na(+)-translocating NADH-quinone reductase subunit C [Chlamydiales bacterium]|nr:Na(+)-translocating NADH-quinone reductase subunit C [Chlamydiales bacterium]